jgi:hypothetical protein
VAHNSLEPEILADALITLQSLNIRRAVKIGGNRDSSVHIRSLYNIIVEANDNLTPLPQLQLTNLMTFFCYQRVVDSFVKDYTSHHIVKYGGPPLSPTELYQLRRAL